MRIVAATNRHLPSGARAGSSAPTCYYRIACCTRSSCRRCASGRATSSRSWPHFLDAGARPDGHARPRAEPGRDARAHGHDWPGNVRELRNAIEYASIRSEGPVIERADLPPEVRAAGAPLVPEVAQATGERERIEAALAHTGGNRKAAAQVLGISRATLYRRLSDFGIATEA